MTQILLIGSTTSVEAETGMLRVFQKEFETVLQAAAMPQGTISTCPYDEIGFTLSKEMFSVFDYHNSKSLIEYDLVVFKGVIPRVYIPQAIGEFLRSQSIPFFNDYRQYKALNKLTQLVDMHAVGVPFPKTLYLEQREQLLGTVEKSWAFPLVVKAVNGSRGRYNFLVSDIVQLRKVLGKHPERHFLVQEYVKGDDYRILIIGKETIVFKRSQYNGSYLRNTSQGAEITTVPNSALPAKVITEARLLAQKMGMTIAGVDVIYEGSGRYHFLEINTQPAIGQPETIDILKHLLQSQRKGIEK